MDGAWRRPPKSLADYGHTEPKRGAEWWGKSPFGYFWGSFPKVTRCKSGTLSGRYLNNGYVPGPTVLTVRPSSQASQLPHLDAGVSGRSMSTVRPPSQASQLPHLDGGVSGRSVSAFRPPSQASQLPHWPRSAYRGDSFTLQAAMPWMRNPQRGKCTCTVPPRSSVRRRISSSRPANSNSPATGSTP